MAYKLIYGLHAFFEININTEDAEMPNFLFMNLVLTVFINNSKLTDRGLGEKC